VDKVSTISVELILQCSVEENVIFFSTVLLGVYN